jgi:hypothetical protein
MRRQWSPAGLIASWTLVDEDWRLVGNKSGPWLRPLLAWSVAP